jgi:hypothetical protein
MANPTTNYGFVMPTSTDLVTDLPADFDVFGQAVDSQMLTNANAAIAKAIVDAKGDIIAATAADTVSLLAVGADGTVLTAASGEATGLQWAAPAGGSWSQAATGSLSGSSVAITGLTGQKYYVALIGWSGTGSEYVQVRFNNDSGNNYRRGDSDSAVAELYVIGASTQPAADTRSNGFFVDMANTSMAGKPLMSVTPKSTNGSVGGFYMSSSTITQINLIISGGTFDAGTYYVWSFA